MTEGNWLSVIDSGWTFAALVVFLVYLLAIKYGNRLLDLAQTNRNVNEEILQRLTRLEARDADQQPPTDPAEG